MINLRRTWEKLLLAARAIVAIEHPSEVFVISSRPTGQRAVLKFATHTGATPIAGRFTPGAFTNQIQVKFNRKQYIFFFFCRSLAAGSYFCINSYVKLHGYHEWFFTRPPLFPSATSSSEFFCNSIMFSWIFPCFLVQKRDSPSIFITIVSTVHRK